MCDWEEFIFRCGCSVTKLKSYCHFARNDPNHQCFGVQVLKKVWDLPEMCDKCLARNWAASQGQTQQVGWPRGQQPYTYGSSSSGSSQTQGQGASRSRR